MALFTACFDCSGSDKDPQTPFLTVAGFLSTADHWIEFTDLWTKRLLKDGIQYFRMAEFAHSVKQFDGWREQEDRRKQLLGDLVDLVKSHAFRKFGTVVQLSAMQKLDDSVRQEFSLTAYALAGRASAGDLRQWALSEGEGLEDTPFALVFEEGDAGQDKLKTRLEEDGFNVNFRPKKDEMKNGILRPGFVPLQAADMLAYEMTQCAKKEDVTRWAADQFIRMPGRIGLFIAEDVQGLQRDLREYGPFKPKA
jgi:hypothetical protein